MFTKVASSTKRQTVSQPVVVPDGFQLVELTPKSLSPALESEGKDEKKETMGPQPVGSLSKALSSSVSMAGKRMGLSVSLPPKINLTPTYRHVFRYVCRSTATAVPVNGPDLLIACGCIATSTTTVYSIGSSVRVHSIRIWPSPNSTTNTSVLVQWQGPITSVERDFEENQDVPAGVSVTGAAQYSPPKDSFCDKWLTGLAINALMLITCPIGAILDVDLSYTSSNALANATQSSLSGLTVGTVYYGTLDGATNALTPVGLNSVV
jgi:hypothetical protein